MGTINILMFKVMRHTIYWVIHMQMPHSTRTANYRIARISQSSAKSMRAHNCTCIPVEELGARVEAVSRMASRKLSRSTTIFNHCLHVCWDLRYRPCASWSIRRLYKTDKVCDLINFASRTKKGRHFHSIVSLRSHFEIYNNNNTPFTWMSQSIRWVNKKL